MICKKCGGAFDYDISRGVCPFCGEWNAEKEKNIIICPSCGKKYDKSASKGVCPYCNSHSPEKEQKKHISYNPKWLMPGTLIHERYEIMEPLGAGGFGITYKAYDRNNGITCAIKEYFQQGVSNRIPGTKEVLVSAPAYKEQYEYGKKRLLHEAQVVAKFQSPNIVRVMDYFEENNTSYMVMEYLPHRDLQSIVENKIQFSIPTIVDIGIKICDALEEINSFGVIHRDIAPDNIILNDNNDIKIIDFGSARLSETDVDDRLIAFKPGYAPPEQYEPIDIKHDKQKEWTDVYAVGATLYALLTGTVPVEATDRKIEVDGKDGKSGIDPVCYPAEINHNIPENLNNTVMTAMAINIHERFKNAKELRAALKGEKTVERIEVVRRKKRMRRTFGISGGLVLGLILFVIGSGIYQNKRAKFDFLEKADVSIWYSYDDSSEDDKGKSEMLNSIVEELSKSDKYANVTIDLMQIDAKEYKDKLKEAYIEDSLPTIYEYEDTIKTKLEDLSSVTQSLSNCYLVDEFRKNTISTGINIPVVYINYMALENPDDEIEVKSIDDLLKLSSAENISMNKQLESQYKIIFPDFDDYADTIQMDINDFMDNKSLVYLSDTSEMEKIVSANAAQYGMIPLDVSKIECSFKDFWTMKDCDDAEEIAGKEILKYFLSNKAQTYGYVEDGIQGIPLEKNTLNEFKENRAVFKDFEFDFKKYQVTVEEE